jgi:hypothetical protein
MRNITEIKKGNLSSKHQPSRDLLQFIPGIWVNEKYYWLYNQAEKVVYDEALIVRTKQEQIHSKIRFSNVFVSNHSSQIKEIKLLGMYLFPDIHHENLTFISPSESRIFHHANQHVFLVNGNFNGTGLKEYTTIPLWSAFTDRIWSSLKTGSLRYQPMVKGQAASIFAMKMMIQPHMTNKMSTWTIAASRKSELVALEQGLLKNVLAFPFEK